MYHGKEYYRLSQIAELPQLVTQLNNLFEHLVDRLDEMIGLRGDAEIDGSLKLGGSIGPTYVAKENSYTTVADDCIILVDTDLAAPTITLSLVSLISQNIVIVKDSSGNAHVNAITIATEGKATIDEQNSVDIFESYKSRILYCNGSNWFTFGGY